MKTEHAYNPSLLLGGGEVFLLALNPFCIRARFPAYPALFSNSRFRSIVCNFGTNFAESNTDYGLVWMFSDYYLKILEGKDGLLYRSSFLDALGQNVLLSKQMSDQV